jgi:predicted transcriptional regulator
MVSSMIRKRETPKPTESELELLGILWDRGPLTVRELFEAVNVGRPVVYTGVLKLLQIMAEKGLVQRDERALISIAPRSRKPTPSSDSCAS